MKKEVENKKSFIRVPSCSESSGDESDKAKSKIDKEELRKYLQNSDEEDSSPPKTSPKKSKKLVKKRITSYNNTNLHDKPIKPNQKDSPQKYLVQGDDLKKLQKKAKKRGANSLDYSKTKNNKYMIEYDNKKIHFGSANTEDFITHKDPIRRDKYLTKAKKITDKDGRFTYKLPFYPNYWSVKLLN